ncbi:MAG: DNA methyltransferase [Parabacteroides sp.]
MRYELLGVLPLEGQWKWKEEKALEAVANYNSFLDAQKENPVLTLEDYWNITGKRQKYIRRRIENGKGKNKGVEHWVEPTEGILRTSNWSDIITTETNLNMELNFSSPKSLSLMNEIIKFGNDKKDSIILDFFAGSGTTLHATMQLNQEDGGHRQCILVTNNENKICEEVTYERNRRVIQGYVTPKGDFVEGLKANTLRYYKTKLLPRAQTNQNRRTLMAACTELLCIQQDLYEEQPYFAGRKLNPHKARYFAQGKRKMLVIYDEQTVDVFAELLREMEVEEPIRIYLFSFNGYPYTDNFMEVLDKVELCALPQAIYNVYQRVLSEEEEALSEEEEEMV